MNTQQVSNIVSQKKSANVTLVYVVALILVILSGVGGFVLGSSLSNSVSTKSTQNITDTTKIEDTQTNNQTIQSNESESTATTSEQEIYTNTAYKYQVTLPKNWKSNCGAAECGEKKANPEDLNPSFTSVNSNEVFYLIMIDPIGLKPTGIAGEKVSQKEINNIKMTIVEDLYTKEKTGAGYAYYAVRYLFQDQNNPDRYFTIFTKDNLERTYKSEIEEFVNNFKFL